MVEIGYSNHHSSEVVRMRIDLHDAGLRDLIAWSDDEVRAEHRRRFGDNPWPVEYAGTSVPTD